MSKCTLKSCLDISCCFSIQRSPRNLKVIDLRESLIYCYFVYLHFTFICFFNESRGKSRGIFYFSYSSVSVFFGIRSQRNLLKKGGISVLKKKVFQSFFIKWISFWCGFFTEVILRNKVPFLLFPLFVYYI